MRIRIQAVLPPLKRVTPTRRAGLRLRVRRRLIFYTCARYSITMSIVAVMLFPLYWMVVSSLKPAAELFAWPPQLTPAHPSLFFYRKIMSATLFSEYGTNSLFIALATTTLSLILGTLGAYSLSRFRYPGRHTLGRLVLFTYMFPSTLLVIPLFVLMTRLQLVNSHAGLIISYTTFLLPFILWLLKGFFDGLPMDMEEAALVDGCNRLQALHHIVLPLAAPGVAAASMVAFLSAWNEYLFASVFILSDRLRTLPVGIASYVTGEYVLWGEMLAATTLVSIPVVIFAGLTQRYLVAGLTAGAVKG